MNMIGPGVARSEADAAALIHRELNQHRGRSPGDRRANGKRTISSTDLPLGGRNCEMHFCQVRGIMQPFQGVNLPSFLPETG